MLQETLSSGFQTRSDINRAVQPQRMAKALKFLTEEVKALYHLCRENKPLFASKNYMFGANFGLHCY